MREGANKMAITAACPFPDKDKLQRDVPKEDL